jgi:hypothetical protein
LGESRQPLWRRLLRNGFGVEIDDLNAAIDGGQRKAGVIERVTPSAIAAIREIRESRSWF